MAKKLGMACPCGFSLVTPHGEDDAVAVATEHLMNPELYLQRRSR